LQSILLMVLFSVVQEAEPEEKLLDV